LKYGGGEAKELPVGELEASPGNIPAVNVESTGQALISPCSGVLERVKVTVPAPSCPCSTIAFLGSCEDPWADSPRFDISVSLDRFLRLYAFRNELLLFHHQKNNAMIGTRTAPTAAGAAMLAMLLEDRFEEPADVVRGIAPVRELELAGVLEPAMTGPCENEADPVRGSDDEPAKMEEVIPGGFDSKGEEAWEKVETGVTEAGGDASGGGIVGDEVDPGGDAVTPSVSPWVPGEEGDCCSLFGEGD
jgi:hypothetical protein